MLNVGLTGGIATGKSMVVQLLADKGASIIDFDHLTRYVQEPGRPGWSAIVNTFGSEIIQEDGTINRRALGEIVFGEPQQLARLNAIVHPLVYEEWRKRLAELRKAKNRNIVIADIPLLIETGEQDNFDLIILVYAPPWLQLERLKNRNGYSDEEARQRLASQLPIDQKIPFASIIIDNSCSRQLTTKRVDEVWEELKNAEKQLINSQILLDMLHPC